MKMKNVPDVSIHVNERYTHSQNTRWKVLR